VDFKIYRLQGVINGRGEVLTAVDDILSMINNTLVEKSHNDSTRNS
jgi:hypothetical protein